MSDNTLNSLMNAFREMEGARDAFLAAQNARIQATERLQTLAPQVRASQLQPYEEAENNLGAILDAAAAKFTQAQAAHSAQPQPGVFELVRLLRRKNG